MSRTSARNAMCRWLWFPAAPEFHNTVSYHRCPLRRSDKNEITFQSLKSITLHPTQNLGLIQLQCTFHEVFNSGCGISNAFKWYINWAARCEQLSFHSRARVKAIKLKDHTFKAWLNWWPNCTSLTIFLTQPIVLMASFALNLAETCVPLATSALCCSYSLTSL